MDMSCRVIDCFQHNLKLDVKEDHSSSTSNEEAQDE